MWSETVWFLQVRALRESEGVVSDLAQSDGVVTMYVTVLLPRKMALQLSASLDAPLIQWHKLGHVDLEVLLKWASCHLGR
jgi:hypothetical protein